MRIPRSIVFGCFLLSCVPASAQIRFVSPRPAGILQVRGDHADLRLRVTVPAGYGSFEYKLSSDIDTTNIHDGWRGLAINAGVIDTLMTVPRSLRAYTLYWRADSAGVDTVGMIGNMTPGHIIGIAGQSNAQGYSDMVEPAWGD